MRLPRGRILVTVALAVAAPLLVVAVALAGRSATAPVTINVTLTDTAIKLSKKTADVGKVTFAVKNTGKKDHSFTIAAKKTPVLKPGKSANLVVTFTKAGSFPYKSTVAADTKLKGTFTTKAAMSTGGASTAAGKEVYISTGCGACHVFKAAGTAGAVGPNLDRSTIPLATVVMRVTSGKGVMQAYAGTLTAKQIEDVSDFVFSARAG